MKPQPQIYPREEVRGPGRSTACLIAKQTPLVAAVERRRFQRGAPRTSRVAYMLANGQEFPCQVAKTMSPGGPGPGSPSTEAHPPGEPRHRLMFDEIGRIAGVVARAISERWLPLRITSTTRKTRQARSPAHLARQSPISCPINAGTRASRTRSMGADHLGRTVLQMDLAASSTISPCRGRVSQSDQRPQIGARITIGRTHARVARHIKKGPSAVEFLRLQHQGLARRELFTGRAWSAPMRSTPDFVVTLGRSTFVAEKKNGAANPTKKKLDAPRGHPACPEFQGSAPSKTRRHRQPYGGHHPVAYAPRHRRSPPVVRIFLIAGIAHSRNSRHSSGGPGEAPAAE